MLTAVLRGSNLSDVGYGPMTGNASADVAAHQFAKGDRGYRLQAGDAYFREARSSMISRKFHRARCLGSGSAA